MHIGKGGTVLRNGSTVPPFRAADLFNVAVGSTVNGTVFLAAMIVSEIASVEDVKGAKMYLILGKG